MGEKNQDLTTGPIGKKLVAFALLLLLGSLVQQLYSTVDLIFVGNMIDSAASAAIGASTMLITCLIRSALLFWIVPHTRSIQSVAAVYPITWGLTALGMCVYYCSENGLIPRRKRQS